METGSASGDGGAEEEEEGNGNQTKSVQRLVACGRAHVLAVVVVVF